MFPFWQDQPLICCTRQAEMVLPLVSLGPLGQANWNFLLVWNTLFFFFFLLWELLCSRAAAIFQCFWGNGCCEKILAWKQCCMVLPKHSMQMRIQKAPSEVTRVTRAVHVTNRFPLQSCKSVCLGFVCTVCFRNAVVWWASWGAVGVLASSFFLLQQSAWGALPCVFELCCKTRIWILHAEMHVNVVRFV